MNYVIGFWGCVVLWIKNLEWFVYKFNIFVFVGSEVLMECFVMRIVIGECEGVWIWGNL